MIDHGQLENQLCFILVFITVHLLTFHYFVLTDKSLNLNYVLYSLKYKFPINYRLFFDYFHQKYLYFMLAIN